MEWTLRRRSSAGATRIDNGTVGRQVIVAQSAVSDAEGGCVAGNHCR